MLGGEALFAKSAGPSVGQPLADPSTLPGVPAPGLHTP